MKYYVFMILLFMPLSALPRNWVKALVKVPVADVSGQSLKACTNSVTSCYKRFPCAPDKGPFACLRLHQLTFNQVVTIIKELPTGEVFVSVPNLFYLDGLHRKRTGFWMLKKDLVPLTSLKKDSLKSVPPPLESKKRALQCSKNVLTLKVPWFDRKTARIYSAGTRFVRDSSHDTRKGYAVVIYDPDLKKTVQSSVPKRKALILPSHDFYKARAVFLALLRSWAHQPSGLVPYVYGGCSFTMQCPKKGFRRISGTRCGKKVSYWERTGFTATPRVGFDCSNMILCAAQIAGLPYFFKNTLALVTSMHLLKRNEKLEEGDLVWYSGHVMVVSNLKKNLLIEAIGYESGYGCVHEVPVHKVFSGIKNFDQLTRAHYTKRFTRRLNSKGKPWRSVYRLKILKLKSIV